VFPKHGYQVHCHVELYVNKAKLYKGWNGIKRTVAALSFFAPLLVFVLGEFRMTVALSVFYFMRCHTKKLNPNATQIHTNFKIFAANIISSQIK